MGPCAVSYRKSKGNLWYLRGKQSSNLIVIDNLNHGDIDKVQYDEHDAIYVNI